MPAEPGPAPGTPGDLPVNWTSCTERSADALVVRLSGELDYPGRAQLEDLLSDVLATAPAVLVVEVSGVAFCDSSSLQILLRVSTRAADLGTGFALAAAGRAVTRPITVLGLAEQLPCYETVDAAVAALRDAR
jgi:anti-anti-sigma factor